jgi:hypothetical protein
MRNIFILVLMAVIAFVANVSFGGLVVDLRAVSATGTTQIANPKTVLPGGSGDVITFQLFAEVAGYSDPTKEQTIDLLQGTIKESIPNASCTTRGDMATIPATDATVTDIYGPVYDQAMKPKLILNSFGDWEFGDTVYGWAARSYPPHDAKDWQYIGTFGYTLKTVDLSASSVTSIEFVPKTVRTGAMWCLDGVTKDGRDGFISNGAVSFVPEPSSIALLGMGILALIAWTRRPRSSTI